MIGGNWDIGGKLGKMAVTGIVENNRVTATGSMAGLTFGAVSGSDFLAGCTVPLGQRYATAHDQFTDPLARIALISIKGLKVPASQDFLIDSNFSAASIGAVKLVNAVFDNDGQKFGFFARDSEGDGEIRSISHKDRITRQRWRWSPADGESRYDDMVVELL